MAGLNLNVTSGRQADSQTHLSYFSGVKVRELWSLLLCTSARPCVSNTQEHLPGCLPRIGIARQSDQVAGLLIPLPLGAPSLSRLSHSASYPLHTMPTSLSIIFWVAFFNFNFFI